MIGLISAGLGLASSIFGKKGKDEQSASVSQGYDYLQSNPLVQQAQTFGQEALTSQQDVTGLRSAVLGMGTPEEQQAAFARFQESPGYQYRLQEGLGGVEASRAARGLLNSGATGKALMETGQNIANQEFGAWMDRLGQQEQMYAGQVNQGLNSAMGVGSAAGSAGMAKADVQAQGDANIMSGIGGLAKGIGSIFGF